MRRRVLVGAAALLALAGARDRRPARTTARPAPPRRGRAVRARPRRALRDSPTPGRTGGARPAPSGGAAARSAGTLLLADFGADTVTFLPADGRGRAASVRVGTAPYGVAVGADGRAWVATAEGLAVVDTRTRERVARVPYRTRTGPVAHGEYRGGGMGVALAPDGRHAYVGVNVPDGRGTLEVVDTRTLRVTAVLPVGRRPFDVDVAPDGGRVYVTAHDSFDVTVIDPGDGSGDGGSGDRGAARVGRRVEVAPYGTEGGLGSWLKPHYAAVRPSDGHLLLPFEGERLVDLDPDTGRSRVRPMTANTHQHGTALTPDGHLLVVGTGPIDPAGDEGPSLTIRAPDGTERLVPLDGPHEDVSASPDGRTAYVTAGHTREGWRDGVTAVDLRTGKTRWIAGGKRPVGVAALE
ncbi:YncE family protein [Streptomyces sp. SPB074]|uniref:YncE family protein n=1 Tax=Streptomyces sp. (strain SPB074) TaxID=465543 RepID=UPI0001D1E0B7|nr:YncE family protein [Streptomyces sp. SPB074]EFG65093.1 40-residue YVTN family beta-propeller repeat protein [Streptomyces sp. SPB074]